MSTRQTPATGPASAVSTGGCQCGAVRYEVRGTPLALYVCHCTECRRQSASAFGISVIVRAADLVLTAGETRVWTRSTDSGARLVCHFCPVCGSRLWHMGSRHPGRVSLKGGSLDAPPDLARAVHIWTRSKVPGVVIPPGAECHPGEPPD